MKDSVEAMRARLLDRVAEVHARVVAWALDEWVGEGLKAMDVVALYTAACTVEAIGDQYLEEVREWLE